MWGTKRFSRLLAVTAAIYTTEKWSTVERFTEGTELMGAVEVQLQSDLIR